MTATTLQEILDGFTGALTAQLDESRLDGPVRLDPTRTIVIIPLKEKGPIHVHVNHQINDEGVRSVINQIAMVPSLKGLVKDG